MSDNATASTTDTTTTQATSPATQSASAGFTWAKEDGSFSEGWIDRLPEDLRGNASLRVLGSVPDLAKSYVETKKLIGSKLEMPGEGATPEQLAAWRKTVGAPEKPEGYLGEAKSLRPEAVPEGLWDVKGEQQFLALAHKHHLPPAAVRDILGFYGQNIAQGLQQSQQQEAATLTAESAKLKEAWGKDYDANMNLAARVARTVGLDPKAHPMFTDSGVVQAFAKLGLLFSEDKLVKGDVTGISGSIKDRIRDITDPTNSSALARDYRGEFGPERQMAAQKQLHELMEADKSN